MTVTVLQQTQNNMSTLALTQNPHSSALAAFYGNLTQVDFSDPPLHLIFGG